MTVLEASANLYEWFSQNNSFCLEKDFIKIITITEHPERDRAAFLSALKDYEEGGMIASSEVESVTYWVLRKSFLTYPQTLSLSAESALMVSTVINKFCDITNSQKDYCDPASVTEDDLRNLISICSFLIDDNEKKIDSAGEVE